MTTVFCTLYNSLYLDKGLVLYDSLCECAKDFKLYVLCMDEKCYEVLTDLKQEHHVPVRLSDFEASDGALLKAKSNRSMSEYCWTCSSTFIRYVLNNYREEHCTYIDADMFFYQDPKLLIDEMRSAGKTVMITPHRFTPDKMHFLKNGIYCVEFNTFCNEEGSLRVLNKWCAQCLECCTSVYDGVHFGDQKYMDSWPNDYPGVVHECQHPGAGTAPWNIGWYRQIDAEKHIVLYKKDNSKVPIVFHHFHQVSYETQHRVRTGVLDGLSDVDYHLVKDLYIPYLLLIDKKKQMLKKRYGIDALILIHPAHANRVSKWKRFLLNIQFVRVLYEIMNPKNGPKSFIIVLPQKTERYQKNAT